MNEKRNNISVIFMHGTKYMQPLFFCFLFFTLDSGNWPALRCHECSNIRKNMNGLFSTLFYLSFFYVKRYRINMIMLIKQTENTVQNKKVTPI